jgi:cytochrome P450 family 135
VSRDDSSSTLPPGPTYNIVRGTVMWLRNPGDFMDNAERDYGHVWTHRAGGTKIVMVSDPPLIEGILTTDRSHLYGEATMVTPLLGEKSVLLLNEDAHVAERKLMEPFFQPERVERHREAMSEIAERNLAAVPLREPTSMLPVFEEITVYVIMTAIFGATGERQDRLHERLTTLLAFRDKDPLTIFRMRSSFHRGTPPPKSFTKVFEPVDAQVYEEIRRAREDPNLEARDDILGLLVQIRREDGSPMTDKEIHDELMTMLIQGHTSTATALSWAIERAVRHPDVLERLYAESESGGDEYIDAFVKEVLRLRSPQPLAMRRVVGAPYSLGEWELPPDTKVAVNTYTLHRRADLWDDPHRFRPERFLERKPDRYAYLPFGGGMRGCLGAAFALTEMREVLRTVMSRLRFAPTEEPDERMRTRGVALSPSGGARVVIQERVQASAPAAVA